jgi:hypothetical protein
MDTQDAHEGLGEEYVAPDEGSGEEYEPPDIEARGSLNDVTQAAVPQGGNQGGNQGSNSYGGNFGFS